MRTIGRTGIVAISIVAALVLLGGSGIATYNKLVRLDQDVRAQWAQVENVYQRRADLVPNLVATVKGAATFERETFTAVTQARSRVAEVAPKPGGTTTPEAGPGTATPEAKPDITTSPGAFRDYQQAQDALGGALSRLLVVVEAYPNLTATQAFRDLQAQLEGTENRISVERMRYNEVSNKYNTARASFPTSIVAGIFGSRFPERQYFTAKAGSDVAPEVKL